MVGESERRGKVCLIYTNIFKSKEIAIPTLFLQFNFTWSWLFILLPPSTTHSLFAWPQQAPFAVHDFISIEVTQTFIPERFGPLAVLPVLGSYSLLLALING